MLRTADKRMRLTEPLPLMFGGRSHRRYGFAHPARLDAATVPPIASPIGWWDASRLSTFTVTATNKVTAWADLSTSGFNGTVPGSSSPWASIVPNKHDGRTVLLGDLMEVTNSLSASDRTQTVFWAGCIESFTTARCMFGASNTGGRLFRIETTGRPACVKRATSNLALATTLTITAGVPFAAGMILSDTEIVFLLNRGTHETFAEATTFTGSRTTSLNGGDSVLGGRPPGWCCEAIAYDGAMSTANAQLVIDYLMTKWNIT